jgi:hypothetical protein
MLVAFIGVAMPLGSLPALPKDDAKVAYAVAVIKVKHAVITLLLFIAE